MYEAFYGFREKPFNLTPDPRFLYLSPKHSEAFAHLEFGLKQRGGFVVVTGEVGTGKTTLCRYFLDHLDPDTVSAFILYPALNAKELLHSICHDLGIDVPGGTAKELVDALHRFLLQSRQAGKNIVLVIDESQNLAPEVLEQIRLVSNLETSTEKLIQIVLIGQSELNGMLAQENLRQLAQRVTARYHLRPLSPGETSEYVRHRIEVAGGLGKVSFTPGALKEVHRFSQGIPRLINLLCDRALLAGFVLSQREIDARLARRAVRELDSIQIRRKGSMRAWLLRATTALLAVAALGWGTWPLVQERLFVSRDAPPELSSGAAEASEATLDPDPGSRPLSEAELDRRLRTLSQMLSRRDAVAALLDVWGLKTGDGAGGLPGETIAGVARRYQLEQTVIRTHFDQLRRLNLPAVLELFHSSRTDNCYAALLGLRGEDALIAFSPGERLQIPFAVLDRYWGRRAVLFWKDFEDLPRDLESERAHDWVRLRLTQMGFLAEQQSEDEGALKSALAAFQESNDLVADGLFGPNTRMALYSLSGQYPVPRLRKP